MSIGIGSFIRKQMKENKIKQGALCKGLCSQSELSKVLLESKILNYFSMERLLDRLGISTEKFEYILPQKDYELCRLRYEIEEQLQERNDNEIKKLIQEYEREGKNSPCHQQYVLYIQAMIVFYTGNKRQAVSLLEKSLACTIPDGFYEGVILGIEEIKLLLLYEQLRYELKESEREQEEYYDFLESVKQYIDDRIKDEEVKASIYPRVTIGLIGYDMEKGLYEKAKQLCQTSIALLTRHFMLYQLLEHIGLLREIYEHIPTDEKEKYQVKQMYNTLSSFYKDDTYNKLI